MESAMDSVFQFHDQETYPIYVRLKGLGEGDFSQSVIKILEQMKFRELSDSEAQDIEKHVHDQGRILELSPASSRVTAQIESASTSDRYGPESVLPKNGYKVYRFRSAALMVYSYGASTWECGITDGFGQGDEGIFAARTVINRFLSWALAPHGVIGLWGVPVKEGLVVLKQSESQGEVVFVDMNKRKILSMDGLKHFPLRFRIMRLDNKIRNKNVRMTNEQLLSFLSVHTSFLDPEGHSRAIRQLLQAITKQAEGVTHPRESFQSREESL